MRFGFVWYLDALRLLLFYQIDKEGADAESVKAQLMREGVVVEELGGDSQCCAVSSVSGAGIAELLEKINLQVLVHIQHVLLRSYPT